MEHVYNLNFKAYWKASFMNCVERLIWPVKTIHTIPILKGKLKVKVMERLYSCICRWITQIGCLWANEKATCQASYSRAMSASEMGGCLGEMICCVCKQGKASCFRNCVDLGTSVFWLFISPFFPVFSTKKAFAYEDCTFGFQSCVLLVWFLGNEIGTGGYSK